MVLVVLLVIVKKCDWIVVVDRGVEITVMAILMVMGLLCCRAASPLLGSEVD